MSIKYDGKAHRHAKLIAIYAEIASKHSKPWELIQWKQKHINEWIDLDSPPMWDDDYEYRVKPREIIINGVKCPAPETSPLKNGDYYFAPSLTSDDLVTSVIWGGFGDIDNLERGLVFLKPADARLVAKALLKIISTANDEFNNNLEELQNDNN